MVEDKQRKSLGELISAKRKEASMTRAELARQTDINEQSLKRYELAGMPGGQYPPSPKLAALCFRLKIPAAEALFSCLDEADYEITSEKIDAGDDAADRFLSDVISHPEYQLMLNENFYLTEDNAKMRAILRFIAIEEDGNWLHTPKIRRWIKRRLTRDFKSLEEVEKRLIAEGAISPLASFGFSRLTNEEDDDSFDVEQFSDLGISEDIEHWPADRKKAVKGLAGKKRRELLELAIQLIDQVRNEEEDPDQSPNSPGSSENK